MQLYRSWKDVPGYLMTRHSARMGHHKLAADAKPAAQISTRRGRVYDLYQVGGEQVENALSAAQRKTRREFDRLVKLGKARQRAFVRTQEAMQESEWLRDQMQ